MCAFDLHLGLRSGGRIEVDVGPVGVGVEFRTREFDLSGEKALLLKMGFETFCSLVEGSPLIGLAVANGGAAKTR